MDPAMDTPNYVLVTSPAVLRAARGIPERSERRLSLVIIPRTLNRRMSDHRDRQGYIRHKLMR